MKTLSRDVEESKKYDTYGYSILDAKNMVVAGSLTRDYFFAIKLLSDLVDKTGSSSYRIIPLLKSDYDYLHAQGKTV